MTEPLPMIPTAATCWPRPPEAAVLASGVTGPVTQPIGESRLPVAIRDALKEG